MITKLLILALKVNAMVQLDLGRIIVGENSTYIAGHENRKANKLDPVVLGNDYYYYYATIGLGSPPQKLHVQVDTGSSDLWVMDASNPYCKLQSSDQDAIDCSDSLVFNPSKSSSYQGLDESFSIDYADSTFARGKMAREVISIGSQSIPAAKFALANRANSAQIVMGIGFQANEAARSKYENVPMLMKSHGLIQTNTYSLWLNDLHAQSGSILFGAVDHSKYTGKLARVPIVSTSKNSKPDQMMIMLSGISVGAQGVDNTQLVDSTLPVLLDSGTSYVYLPTKIAQSMAKALNMHMDHSSGMYVGAFPKHTNGFFEFSFSGAKVRAPLELMIDPAEGDRTGKLYELLIVPSDDGTNILGDAFLRAAYIVYDLDNFEVGIAPAKFNVQTQLVEEITQRIPGNKAQYYSQTTSTYLKTYNLRAPVNLVDTGTAASTSRNGNNIGAGTTMVIGSKTVKPYSATRRTNTAAWSRIKTAAPSKTRLMPSMPYYVSTPIPTKAISKSPTHTNCGSCSVTGSPTSVPPIDPVASRFDHSLQAIISSLSAHRATLMQYLETKKLAKAQQAFKAIETHHTHHEAREVHHTHKHQRGKGIKDSHYC